MEIKAGETRETVTEKQEMVTSHPTEVDSLVGDRQNDFGKFSTAEELVSAYNSLESEFTRRCQKLKELERENERLKKLEQPVKDSEKEVFQRGKAFRDKYPDAEKLLPSLYDLAAKSGDEAEGFLERAYVNYLKGELENQKSYYSSNSYILEKAYENQAVKDGIIREYLVGVDNSKPTVGRFKGNGESIITPPSKPKTLSEANRIASIIFQKAKEIK